MLPFDAEQFARVFVDYNRAIWPLQIAAELLGLLAAALLSWRPPGADRLIAAILAAFWLQTGLVYHLLYFAQINPAAYAFGAGFVIQAAIFVVEGAWRGRLGFVVERDVASRAALLLLAYALLIYPAAGLLSLSPYPGTPLFGVAPCPTVIFTLALLMLARHPRLWLMSALPLAWSVIGGSAALLLDVPQDVGLPVAGAALALTLALGRNRNAGSRRSA